MPKVYSVSHITRILSGIIKNEPTFQEVSVTGKVSVDNLPGVFWLSDEENKIRCFIPGGSTSQFGPLLTVGNRVVVNGKITLYAPNSDYQISVKNNQEGGVQVQGNNQSFSVSGITNRLLEIIGNSSELQTIKVQGRISNFASIPTANLWHLSDTSNGALVGNAVQKIHCFFNPSSINDAISVGDGDEVQIQGAIYIYGPSSKYQITVKQIEPNHSVSVRRCQCPGCAQCGRANRCDRLREVASFESCATCLPRPPDELYELCSQCYENSGDHETKVAEAVYAYFNELQVNGFSPYKECRQIQFGSRNGKADVVLGDENGGFAAIAECKGAGYVGHGIEQLKSYLSATDTRFGVFANKADDSEWEFYENRRRNQFDEIDRSEFEAGVVERIATRERLKDEIGHLNGEITELENQRSELDITVNQIMRTKHNLTERISNLTQQIEALENYKPELHEEIRRKLEELLEEKMQS